MGVEVVSQIGRIDCTVAVVHDGADFELRGERGVNQEIAVNFVIGTGTRAEIGCEIASTVHGGRVAENLSTFISNALDFAAINDAGVIDEFAEFDAKIAKRPRFEVARINDVDTIAGLGGTAVVEVGGSVAKIYHDAIAEIGFNYPEHVFGRYFKLGFKIVGNLPTISIGVEDLERSGAVDIDFVREAGNGARELVGRFRSSGVDDLNGGGLLIEDVDEAVGGDNG